MKPGGGSKLSLQVGAGRSVHPHGGIPAECRVLSSSRGSAWSVLLAALIASPCRCEASSSCSVPRPHTRPSSTAAAKLLAEAPWVISCRREAGIGAGLWGEPHLREQQEAREEHFTQVPRELGKALRSFSMMSSRHMLTSWVLASTSSAVGRRGRWV